MASTGINTPMCAASNIFSDVRTCVALSGSSEDQRKVFPDMYSESIAQEYRYGRYFCILEGDKCLLPVVI